MKVALWRQLRPKETIARAAMQHDGHVILATEISGNVADFPIKEGPGRYVIEAETTAGRLVWAKLDFK